MGVDKAGQSVAELMALTVSEIVAELVTAHHQRRDVNLNRLKCDISKKYGLKSQPKLVDIISAVPAEHRDALVPKLKAKPVRTASGIAIVAVMSKPHRCPHINYTGNICVYCPGGPDSDFEYSTQSYTGYEPTSMRAIRARYDPFVQTRGRLQQLVQLGHNVDKVEFIVMGGTFMSLPDDYRDYFMRRLHDALSGHTSNNVNEAVVYSERAHIKCIGITIETRPDYCLPRHIDDMLAYGCTRLEIGVQSIYEDVALDTNRGHTVRATCECFSMSKDAGYKVVAHMMPNLPNVPIERDMQQFVEYFSNPDFCSDGLKIYPTLVIRGTGLYEMWKTGRYQSYAPQVLVDLVARILALVPPYVRVYRVQRDIPMPLVSSGVEYGNLREHALARMDQLGLRCRDIRTREVGITEIHKRIRPDAVSLVRRDYFANGGWETFISYEDLEQDILIGLVRLRKCSEKYTYRKELIEKKPNTIVKTDAPLPAAASQADADAAFATSFAAFSAQMCALNPGWRVIDELPSVCAPASPPPPPDTAVVTDMSTCACGVSIVRELHVYGSIVSVGQYDVHKFQHKGIGTQLMTSAASIARDEHGAHKLAVISGVGTRNYYRKLGYKLDGPYMSKALCT